MRRHSAVLALGILVLPGAVAASIPRGSEEFRLAASRTEVDSMLASRGLPVISSGFAHLACEGRTAGVEFEQYDFVPGAGGEGRLWRVTIAYRVPYSRADFAALRDQMEQSLGKPAQVDEPSETDPGGVHEVTWVDARTTVQLAARWPERPDPSADRMLVTWTDRRLQKVASAQRRQESKRGR